MKDQNYRAIYSAVLNNRARWGQVDSLETFAIAMSSLTDAVPVLYPAWLNIISNLDIVVFILPYIILSVISVAIYRHYRHQYRRSWRIDGYCLEDGW
jgi:hypothetical protein